MGQRTGSDMGSSSLQLPSLVNYTSSLHLAVILYLLSYYEVAQHTDGLPVTPLEWQPVSVIQFSGLTKPSAWMWSERGE